MKKIIGFACAALVAGTTAMVSPVFAEDAKPASVTGYVQAGYTYNTNTPASQENDFRVFDHKADSFGLDLAQIVVSKDAAAGNAGYKIKLSAGETAKWIHSRGLSGAPLFDSNGAAVAQAGQDTDAFDITEAFVTYTAPVGKGLRFDFGKMVTYHGAEVIEAKDNVNYSRSLLFNYAIPFTHTGLKMTYAFADALSASVHVVNGWDNSDDNNSGKTAGLSIYLAPVEMFSAYINYMAGPEQDDNVSNTRSLIDVVATIKPIKPLSIILNYDTATEETGAGSADVKWSGFAGIVKYDINDTYSVAVRAEQFDDKDGVRTLVAGGQKLTEYTLTPEIRLASGFILRPEYRHDSSDKEVFSSDSGAKKKSQDTIALGVMYSW
jgi:hypothetical protein